MTKFLSSVEEKSLIEAIGKAEDRTSGEIRVHLETKCSGEAYQRAIEIFYELKMNETKDQNGVLIYISTEDHKLAIIGDHGINAVVPEGFWNETLQLMKMHFSAGQFCAGLVLAIEHAGEKLSNFFPYQNDDTDELSNEISFGR